MLSLQYDPITTELVFKEMAEQSQAYSAPAIASFSRLFLTANTKMYSGKVLVEDFIDVGINCAFEIGPTAIVEVT